MNRPVLVVRRKPGQPSRALVRFGSLAFQAAIGRSGISALKREGDGATPRGVLPVLSGFRKGGSREMVVSATALYRAGLDDGWCDAPGHARYNRMIRRPFGFSHELMLREDQLYDLVLVLDWNYTRRRRNGGSAIFLHVASQDYKPTEGCVALSKGDLKRILPFIRRGATVRVG